NGASRWTTGCRELTPHIVAAAREANVDEGLVAGIVAVESGFRSVVKSRSHARGPMQILPSTGRALGCGGPSELAVPAANIRCGAGLLARLIAHYDGRVMYALAAYHGGPRGPDGAFARRAPIDLAYVEAVVRARARWLRRGCEP
ncbi:MAG: transglycosylase SLT domain-containing protein, partial [Myxococcota bacterium]